MYTVYACARVIIIESVPSDARNPMPYQDRGWCFFEATISIMCGSLVLFDEYFSDRKWQMLQLKLKALGGVATSEAKELDVFCAAWNKELNKKMFVNNVHTNARSQSPVRTFARTDPHRAVLTVACVLLRNRFRS